jgi:hypothetical protein
MPAVVLAALLVVGLVRDEQRARAAPPEDGPPRTVLRVFVPWLPDGTLNPALTVRTRLTLEGNPNTQTSCQVHSLATTRPDAWRCVTADPCFEPPLGRSDYTVVACSNGPWLNEVVLLDLRYPLPDPQACREMPGCRPPLDLSRPPWALELANGTRCTPFLGASWFVAGLRANWACLDPDGGERGVVIGDLDRDHDVWRAFYLPEGGYMAEQVDVLVAWY